MVGPPLLLIVLLLAGVWSLRHFIFYQFKYQFQLFTDTGSCETLWSGMMASLIAAFFACLGCERLGLGHSKFSNKNGALGGPRS